MFGHGARSYRELPVCVCVCVCVCVLRQLMTFLFLQLRFADFGVLHRNEMRSGAR